MLLVPKATRASFCARKFTSLVDFEQLKMPSAFAPRASMLRRKPSAAASSAASHETGRSAPSTRTRGSVRRGYDRGVRPFRIHLVYPAFTAWCYHPRMQRAGIGLGVWMAAVALAGALLSAQVDVKPIAPPAAPLPTEAASEGVSKFSFIAY